MTIVCSFWEKQRQLMDAGISAVVIADLEAVISRVLNLVCRLRTL